MPLVPAALLVFVNDAADDHECFVVVVAFGADLDGRAVRRQIGHLADFFQIDVGAHQDGLAVLADGLHAAGPAEDNLRAAVGTVREGWVIAARSPGARESSRL